MLGGIDHYPKGLNTIEIVDYMESKLYEEVSNQIMNPYNAVFIIAYWANEALVGCGNELSVIDDGSDWVTLKISGEKNNEFTLSDVGVWSPENNKRLRRRMFKFQWICSPEYPTPASVMDSVPINLVSVLGCDKRRYIK